MNQENKLIVWLKRIFSIQTLSISISLFAAYFTYMAYMENKREEISIEFPILSDEESDIQYIDVKEIKNYWHLGFYTIPPVGLNNAMLGGINNMLCFPIISNKSNKSLQNFVADIYIWHDECTASMFSDSMSDDYFLNLIDYNIVSQDNCQIHLKYTRNFLPSNTILPEPIHTFMLYRANEDISTKGGEIHFLYQVTYDGAKEPVVFRYNTRMIYNETINDNFTNKITYQFLSNDVFSNYLRNHKYDNGEWAIIINNKIYRNIKHLTHEDFSNLSIHKIEDLQN